MGRKRHTPERIITALRETEVGLARGKSVPAAAFPRPLRAIKPSPWFLRMPALHGPPQVLGLT